MAKVVTMGVGSLGMKLGKKFLTRNVVCKKYRVANSASVTDSGNQVLTGTQVKCKKRGQEMSFSGPRVLELRASTGNAIGN